MTGPGQRSRVLVACSPLIFIAHVLEEAPGFVEWFNSHVSPGISPQSFWQVNLTALVITVVVSAVAWFGMSEATALLVVAWLSCLMGANALLHIAGAIVDRGYVPGVVTSIVAYLPFFALVFRSFRRQGVSTWALSAASVAGAVPMLIHGYRILFLGTRLF